MNQTLPPFDIREHLEQLIPSGKGKRGKYLCPICGDDNFTIRAKDGAFQCWGSGCEPTAIIKHLSPIATNGHRSARPPLKRQKSSKEKQQSIAHAGIAADAKVTELAYLVESGSSTKAEALISVSAWAKEEGQDAYAAKQLLQEKLKAIDNQRPRDTDDLKLLKSYQILERDFGHRLKFNELTKEVELDMEEFDPTSAKVFLEVDHGVGLKANQDAVGQMVVRLARKNPYHPIRNYLEAVAARWGEDTSILDGLAARYFGQVEYIHEVMLFRWLISAVARVMQPGCKSDTALILQGTQGYNKSSFFSTLASDAWFDDSFDSGTTGKDEKLKIHLVWMMEWAELETVFKRKDVSQVKSFLTSKFDLIRPPYGRKTERMARSCIIVGTTNEREFLADTTGNRRFWVIPIQHRIDKQQLAQERDRIWAAAVHCYRAGEPWWLSDEEEAIAAQDRSQFEYKDAWYDDIADLVEFKTAITTGEVCRHLNIEVDRKNAGINKRIAAILTQLGFSPGRHPVMYEGKRQRIWRKI